MRKEIDLCSEQVIAGQAFDPAADGLDIAGKGEPEPEEEEEIGWGAFCDSLELDRRLARAVAQLGWTRPSLVQKATLPVASHFGEGVGIDVFFVTDQRGAGKEIDRKSYAAAAR